MKWISLKDEWPQLNQQVLTTDGFDWFVDAWSERLVQPFLDDDSFETKYYWESGEKITHWAHLPELPKR